MNFKRFLTEKNNLLSWVDVKEVEDNDVLWSEYFEAVAKLLGTSTSQLVYVNSEEVNLSEKDLYEGAFQDTFGVSAQHSDKKNFAVPEGASSKKAPLEAKFVDDQSQTIDMGGVLITLGSTKLLISYPEGAGVCFYKKK